MQPMIGALRAIKHDLPQRSVTTQDNPKCFKQEKLDAGFCNIEICSVTKAFSVGSAGEFWENMVMGCASIQMMKKETG